MIMVLEYIFPENPWPLTEAGLPNLDNTEYLKKAKPVCISLTPIDPYREKVAN